MVELDKLAWEILNTTADDCENLEQIYRTVCRESALAPTTLSEIAGCIRNLVESGLLDVAMDEEGHSWTDSSDMSFVWRGWFRMTVEGKRLWESAAHFAAQNA